MIAWQKQRDETRDDLSAPGPVGRASTGRKPAPPRNGISQMFTQSDLARNGLSDPSCVLGAIMMGTLPARTDVVCYPTNSRAALLIRSGGRIVASTAGTVFIRAGDGQ